MSVIKMQAFSGMLPAVDDRLLPENAAAYSRDAYLNSGTLIGWRAPKLLFNLLASTTRYAYRIPVDNARTGIADTSYWLEFDDKDTNVVRTPVIDDSFERFYYASPSVRPKYNTKARIAAGLSPWFLGVPAPTDAPGVSPSGGSGAGIAAARSYVYTYVTAYGEESAPSPPLVQNGYLDDTWEVTLTSPVANDMGVDRNIETINIYRTVTGTNGVASFFLVDTVSNVTTSYNDSLTDETVAQNVELPSATWGEPPSDLKGISLGANGMIAGFKENEVWFCEPFRPHAWPSVYVLTTEFPIVGIGVCGQSFIVITTGYPVVLTGPQPDSITASVVHKSEPCTSRGSIVSTGAAVFYTSPNGLQAVTPYGTISNTTEKWFQRDQWQQLPLLSVRAVHSGPDYFALGAVYVDPATAADNSSQATTGFTIQSPQTTSEQVSAPPGAGIVNPAFGWLSSDAAVFNMMMDFWTAVPLVIKDQKVYYYDFADTAPTITPYVWKSRIYQEQAKKNYEAMRLWFNVPPGTTPQNATRTITPTIATLASDMYGIVRVYADGVLVTTREIRTSGELLRINSGFKADFWQWEIEGRVAILNMQVATNVKELANA